MKTAVSIPDGIFEAAEKTAQKLGIPRSQLFAKALEEFIKNHNKDAITERLNKVYHGDMEVGEELLDAGLRTLRKATEHDTW
jgi:metal-responsive CopG/Arc/MetJ family transcriptional regulator